MSKLFYITTAVLAAACVFLGMLAWGGHKASARWQASHEAAIQVQDDVQARSEKLFRDIQKDIESLSKSKARLETENRELGSSLIQLQRGQLEQQSYLKKITAERQQLRDDLRRANSRLETGQANFKAHQEMLEQIRAEIKTQEESKARFSAEELRQAEKAARLEGQVDTLIRTSAQRDRVKAEPSYRYIYYRGYYPAYYPVVTIRRGHRHRRRHISDPARHAPGSKSTNRFFTINQRLRDSSDSFFSINRRIGASNRSPRISHRIASRLN